MVAFMAWRKNVAPQLVSSGHVIVPLDVDPAPPAVDTLHHLLLHHMVQMSCRDLVTLYQALLPQHCGDVPGEDALCHGGVEGHLDR